MSHYSKLLCKSIFAATIFLFCVLPLYSQDQGEKIEINVKNIPNQDPEIQFNPGIFENNKTNRERIEKLDQRNIPPKMKKALIADFKERFVQESCCVAVSAPAGNQFISSKASQVEGGLMWYRYYSSKHQIPLVPELINPKQIPSWPKSINDISAYHLLFYNKDVWAGTSEKSYHQYFWGELKPKGKGKGKGKGKAEKTDWLVHGEIKEKEKPKPDFKIIITPFNSGTERGKYGMGEKIKIEAVPKPNDGTFNVSIAKVEIQCKNKNDKKRFYKEEILLQQESKSSDYYQLGMIRIPPKYKGKINTIHKLEQKFLESEMPDDQENFYNAINNTDDCNEEEEIELKVIVKANVTNTDSGKTKEITRTKEITVVRSKIIMNGPFALRDFGKPNEEGIGMILSSTRFADPEDVLFNGWFFQEGICYGAGSGCYKRTAIENRKHQPEKAMEIENPDLIALEELQEMEEPEKYPYTDNCYFYNDACIFNQSGKFIWYIPQILRPEENTSNEKSYVFAYIKQTVEYNHNTGIFTISKFGKTVTRKKGERP